MSSTTPDAGGTTAEGVAASHTDTAETEVGV